MSEVQLQKLNMGKSQYLCCSCCKFKSIGSGREDRCVALFFILSPHLVEGCTFSPRCCIRDLGNFCSCDEVTCIVLDVICPSLCSLLVIVLPIGNKVSQPRSALHKGSRKRKHFCYCINVKPEHGAHPWQSAKRLQRQSSISLPYVAKQVLPITHMFSR